MSDPFFEFVKESNRIEGIFDDASHADALVRLEKFIALDKLTLEDVCEFNTAGALRIKRGMDVMVGRHRPPDGGPDMDSQLNDIINRATDAVDPYYVHHEFEKLHPFMDGNGRTGRAIWLWQMINQANYKMNLGFLHLWYYQSLEHGR